MPRKPLIVTHEFPYHVTARCNKKEPFPCSLKNVWRIISNELNEIIERFDCKIHAFVLMPNHFHLLMTTPKDDLGKVMHFFMGSVAKKLNSNSGQSGRIFGSRYHWSLIDHEQYYDCALKYIYRNPVKAGLQEKVELYEFSTLKYVLEEHLEIFAIEPPIGHYENIPHQNTEAFLRWLNRPFSSEQQDAIKKGFHKTRFTPTRMGWKKNNLTLNFNYE